MHIITGAARVAEPAGRLRVHNHRVTNLDVGHRGSDLLDPTCVLVAQDVGQLESYVLLHRSPVTVADVDVGAAESRRADPYDHVERTVYPRFVDLVDPQILVVVVQPRRFHALTSFSGIP